ncbi:unnamed protein product [Symbiodinium sp. KB8]|nr:unnamed protein product [Symbiodinium sp. KB8]
MAFRAAPAHSRHQHYSTSTTTAAPQAQQHWYPVGCVVMAMWLRQVLALLVAVLAGAVVEPGETAATVAEEHAEEHAAEEPGGTAAGVGAVDAGAEPALADVDEVAAAILDESERLAREDEVRMEVERRRLEEHAAEERRREERRAAQRQEREACELQSRARWKEAESARLRQQVELELQPVLEEEVQRRVQAQLQAATTEEAQIPFLVRSLAVLMELLQELRQDRQAQAERQEALLSQLMNLLSETQGSHAKMIGELTSLTGRQISAEMARGAPSTPGTGRTSAPSTPLPRCGKCHNCLIRAENARSRLPCTSFTQSSLPRTPKPKTEPKAKSEPKAEPKAEPKQKERDEQKAKRKDKKRKKSTDAPDQYPLGGKKPGDDPDGGDYGDLAVLHLKLVGLFLSLPFASEPPCSLALFRGSVCTLQSDAARRVQQRLETGGKPTLRVDLNPDGTLFVALDMAVSDIPSVRGVFHISVGQFRFDNRISIIQLLDSLTWQVAWWSDWLDWIDLEPYGRGLHFGVCPTTPWSALFAAAAAHMAFGCQPCDLRQRHRDPLCGQ